MIPARQLQKIEGDEALTAYLRRRTYLLKHRGAGEVAAMASATPRIMRTVAAIGDVKAMAGEIEALPVEQQLVEAEENLVAMGRAEQMPAMMREIGRLRDYVSGGGRRNGEEPGPGSIRFALSASDGVESGEAGTGGGLSAGAERSDPGGARRGWALYP